MSDTFTVSLCVGWGRNTGLSDACTVSLCVGRGSGLIIVFPLLCCLCLVSLSIISASLPFVNSFAQENKRYFPY